MACTGCDVELTAYSSLGNALTGEQVNVINPGDASQTQPPQKFETYPTSGADIATFIEADPGNRFLAITLEKYWFTGWNGSCTQDTVEGCIESESCSLRLFLNFKVEVIVVFNADDTPWPAIPTMPTVSIGANDPSVIAGYTEEGGTLLPSEQSGTVTAESSGAIVSPSATFGYRPSVPGSSLMEAYRNYRHQVEYLGTPGCGTWQEWTADLSNWSILVTGGSFSADETFSDLEVQWGCKDCCAAVVPPAGGGIGPGTGKNHDPDSIE